MKSGTHTDSGFIGVIKYTIPHNLGSIILCF